MKRLICIVILVLLCTSFAYAKSYNSTSYSLTNAKIAIVGGKAISSNYTLDFVTSSDTLAGISESANYLLIITNSSISQTTPPEITQVLLQSAGNQHKGWPVDVSVTADDPEGDPIEYRYLINNIEVQPWTSDGNITITQEDAYVGLNDITVEARTPADTAVTKKEQLYLFREPIKKE